MRREGEALRFRSSERKEAYRVPHLFGGTGWACGPSRMDAPHGYFLMLGCICRHGLATYELIEVEEKNLLVEEEGSLWGG